LPPIQRRRLSLPEPRTSARCAPLTLSLARSEAISLPSPPERETPLGQAEAEATLLGFRAGCPRASEFASEAYYFAHRPLRNNHGSQERISAASGMDLEQEHDGREQDSEDEGGACEDEGAASGDDEPSLGWTIDGCPEHRDLEQCAPPSLPQNRTQIDRPALTVETTHGASSAACCRLSGSRWRRERTTTAAFRWSKANRLLAAHALEMLPPPQTGRERARSNR
jgi:hypothetical protein